MAKREQQYQQLIKIETKEVVSALIQTKNTPSNLIIPTKSCQCVQIKIEPQEDESNNTTQVPTEIEPEE